MSFLIGLNDTYVVVQGQILLMDPLLSKLFSLLLQDEKQRKVAAAKKMRIATALALATLATKNAENLTKLKFGRP